MRNIFYIVFLIFSTVNIAKGETSLLDLPTKEINGTEYYIYEVGRGETLYNIANRFNWDYDEIIRVNSNTVGDLKKGSVLYYPTGRIRVITETNLDLPGSGEMTFEPIVHKVKKGESVYGIAHRYEIPLEEIYEKYPSTIHGIKPGEVFIFEQTPETISTGFYYYTIKSGDSMALLARDYETTEEDIYKFNPGLSKKSLKPGEIIRIRVGSSKNKIKSELIEDNSKILTTDKEEEENKSEKMHINENMAYPEEITNNIDEIEGEEYKQSQSIIRENFSLKDNNDSDFISEDENSFDYGESDITTSEDNEEKNSSLDSLTERIVNVALLLDDPSSNKDIEFTRGFLLALKDIEKPEYKINFKVFDGRISSNDILSNLEDFEPTFVISTADKAFPAFLADYGNTNAVEVINVFDVKNDLYEDNPSMIQLLPSSELFNEMISEYISKKFSGRKLLITGKKDESDGVIERLKDLVEPDDTQMLTIEEFSQFLPVEDESYVVYVSDSKKEEVADVMQAIENIYGNNPTVDMRIIGKPNWIIYIDDFENRFTDYGIYIPSRVMLATENEFWDDFLNSYKEEFGGTPLKSFPNFAASGYDTANYFIRMAAKNNGDFNNTNYTLHLNPFHVSYNLERLNNWSGFINNRAYLIRYNKYGSPEMIELN